MVIHVLYCLCFESCRRLHGKLWSSHAHQGSVVAAKLVPIAGGKNRKLPYVIVTGCSSGIVKAWSSSSDGELAIVGFFSTAKHMTCLAPLEILPASRSATSDRVVFEPYMNIYEYGSKNNANADSNGSHDLAANHTDQITYTSEFIQVHLENNTRKSSLGSTALDSKMPGSLAALEAADGKSVTKVASDASVSGSTSLDESVRNSLSDSVYIVCVCGFSSGLIESWSLSNSKANAFLEPSAAVTIHKNTITSVEAVNAAFSYAAGQRLVVSASLDGVICLSTVDNDGHLIKLNYFSVPAPVRRTILRDIYPTDSLSAPSDSNSNILPIALELVCFGEKDVKRTLLLSTCIPPGWKSEAVVVKDDIEATKGKVSAIRDSMEPASATANTNNTSDNILREMVDDSTPLSLNSEHGDGKQAIIRRAYVTSQSEQDGRDSREDPPLYHNYQDLEDNQSQYTFSSDLKSIKDPRQRAVLSEKIHKVKKDSRLQELFKHFDEAGQRFIQGHQVSALLEKWLNTGTTFSATILNLLSILNIQANDKLTYFEIAKLAASLSSVINFYPIHTNNLSNSKSQNKRLNKSYQAMQSTKALVKYNSMGEKIVEKIPLGQLAAGVFDGYVEGIRALWRHQSSRVPVHTNDLVGPFPRTLLNEIPSTFSSILSKNATPHPDSVWKPNSENWFDLRRTIRVARTIIDMRIVAQQEFVLRKNQYPTTDKLTLENTKSEAAGKSTMDFNTLPQLPELVTRYFERHFGSAQLNVAHQKIVHFLEACLQYAEYPLMNFLKRYLCPEKPTEALPEVSLWFYVEALSFMRSRGMISFGELVPAYDPVGGSQFTDLTLSTGSALQVHWLVVKRCDAITCVDEMMRIRGGYGPKVVHGVQEIIYGFASTSPTITYDVVYSEDDLIDLDSFLEVISVELSRYEKHISNLSKSLFEDWAIPPTKEATGKPDISGPPHALSPIDQLRQNIRKAEMLEQLSKLHEFVLLLMEYDTIRVGTVNRQVFANIVTHKAPDIFGMKFPSTIDNLIEICGRNYRCLLRITTLRSLINCFVLNLYFNFLS